MSPTADRARSAVVFDFGGVVFRWQPVQLVRTALPHLARDDAAARALAARIYVAGAEWLDFDRGSIDAETLVARLAARIGCTLDDSRALVAAVPAHLEPQAPTVALLHELRAAGRRLCFLSNMPGPYADHLDITHDFMRVFDDGIYSGRVGLLKPEPAIFDLAAASFGIDPERSLFIDDHAANVEAARARGWHALHFVDAPACRDALRAAGWLA